MSHATRGRTRLRGSASLYAVTPILASRATDLNAFYSRSSRASCSRVWQHGRRIEQVERITAEASMCPQWRGYLVRMCRPSTMANEAAEGSARHASRTSYRARRWRTVRPA